MTNLDRVRDRYRNDTMFHTYVDMMRKAIVDLHLTPGELRDAAMLAALIEIERMPTGLLVPLKLTEDRECRHCGRPPNMHDSGTRRCAGGESTYWPVGEPGGG